MKPFARDIADRIYPKGLGPPPFESWWTIPVSRDEWSEVAKREAIRMTTAKSSYAAKAGGTA